jgi:hypothetical protein
VVLAVTCLAGLVACSSSVSGKAVKAPQPVGSADAVVTLMNTASPNMSLPQALDDCADRFRHRRPKEF